MKISPNPKPFHFALGERGEAAACHYLSQNGYQILETNYRCPLGEIDVIARRDGRTVFIEIKTRSSNQFGEPQEAVHAQKQAKLMKIAAWYLKKKKLSDTPIAFDVIAVTWQEGGDPEIRLFQNAFEKEDAC